MSSVKKIGLFACTGVVAGNMMGSGIALLPANLASIGGIAIWGWVISIIGAMSLAYVYARLATKNPQQGGPIAYAGEISPAFGFQTGVLYYHANWIGNLAIGITAVSYLSTFFPALNNPIPAGIACIAIVWLFTFINMLGGAWVSRLTTIGLFLVLIPVVLTQWPAGIGSISRPTTRTGTRLRRPILTLLSKVFCSACGRSLALNLPPSAPAW